MFDFVSVLFFILKKFLKGMKVFRFWRKSIEQCHFQFPVSSYGKIRTPFVVDLWQKKKGFPKVNQQRIVDIFPWFLRFSLFHQNSKFHCI